MEVKSRFLSMLISLTMEVPFLAWKWIHDISTWVTEDKAKNWYIPSRKVRKERLLASVRLEKIERQTLRHSYGAGDGVLPG